MIKNLLEKITAVNYADRDRWNKIKTETINTRYQIVWDAASGLDIYPMVAKALDRVPRSIQLQNAILVMSDYSSDELNILKNVYKKLNHGPVRLPVRVKSVYKKLNHGPVQVLRTSPPDVFEQLEKFNCNVDLNYRNFVGNAFIDQMIPLKLWGDDERDKFKNAYTCYNDWHPVPDDDWHLVYFLFRFSSNAGEVVFPVVDLTRFSGQLISFRERSPKWEEKDHIQQHFASKWSRWSDRVVVPTIWPKSLNRPPRRLVPGCVKQIAMKAVETMG